MSTDQFVAWGPSHVVVVVVTLVGIVPLVLLGRRGDPATRRRTSRVLAVALVVTTLAYQLYAFEPARAGQTLPLWLSDLAPYAAALALWTHRWWAVAPTFYWGLTLTPQALLTPALAGPDFPSVEFLAFFVAHVLPVWAAVLLAAEGRRPDWRGYRLTVAVTVVWGVVAQSANVASGANYGYLDRKPDTPSLLDLFGPWPVYLLVEAVVVGGIWALMTLRRPGGRGTADGARMDDRADADRSLRGRGAATAD